MQINEDDLQFNEDNLQINKDDECSYTEENVNEEVRFDQYRDTRKAKIANLCPPSQSSTLIKDLKINLAPTIMSDPIILWCRFLDNPLITWNTLIYKKKKTILKCPKNFKCYNVIDWDQMKSYDLYS